MNKLWRIKTLQNVYIEEVIAPKLDLKINDIITKRICIEIENWKMFFIFEIGTVLSVKNKSLKHSKVFMLKEKIHKKICD